MKYQGAFQGSGSRFQKLYQEFGAQNFPDLIKDSRFLGKSRGSSTNSRATQEILKLS